MKYELTTLKTLFGSLGFRWADEEGAFPEGLCTVPNEREPNVRDSEPGALFMLLVVDQRFASDRFEFTLGRPYITWYETRPEDVSHGWVTLGGNRFFDSADRPIYNDHDSVVAWKPVAADYRFTP